MPLGLPELGSSAVHRLLGALGRALATDFGTDPVLGRATLNVGTLQGGVAANVLAPEAEARIALRVVTSLEETERQLREALLGSADGGAAGNENLEIEFLVRMPPARLASLEGFEETVVRYGTDVPFLDRVGTPLLYGPGSIHDAHTRTERISKASIELAVEHLVEIVRRLRSGEGIKHPR